MSSLFSKDNLIKIFAIVIVLGFVAEMFAIYTNRTPEASADETPGETAVQPIFGVAIVNVTVTSYEDALGSTIRAEGDFPLIEKEVANLRSEGLVTYSSRDQSGVVLNLPKGANFSKVVGRLSAINATLMARADVSIQGPLVFYTENGTITLSIKTMRISLDPSIPPGYTVGMKITASIAQEKILESIYEIVPVKKSILTIANVEKLYPDYSAIGVLEWTERNVDKNKTGDYLSQRFSNVGVLAIINNTVAFNKPVSLNTIAGIYLLNLTYLRNMSTRSMLFYPNFTDNTTLEQDLSPLLSPENITLAYPLSYVRMDFSTGNFSQEFLNSSMNAAAFFVYRKATIQLGTTVADDEGKKYIPINRDFTDYYPYMNETGGTKLVSINANILGNKILNYTVNEG